MNKLNIINKDILTVDQGIVCHQVNCMKVMGSGLALSIRKLYPQVYQAYISKPKWELGDVQFVEITTMPSKPRLVIANLAGQYTYGTHSRQTDIEALRVCFTKVNEYSNRTGLKVYLPYYLGSDRAGGLTQESKEATWKEVSRLIEEYIPGAVICKKN